MLDDLLELTASYLFGGLRRNPRNRAGAARRCDRYSEGLRVFVPVTLLLTPLVDTGRQSRRRFEVRAMKDHPTETTLGWWDKQALGTPAELLSRLSVIGSDDAGHITRSGRTVSGTEVAMAAQGDDWSILDDCLR